MIPNTRRVEALLLDFDGTIVDSHALIFRCLCDTLERHAGWVPESALWTEMVGLPLSQIFPAAYRMRGEAALSDEEVAAMILTYRARLEELEGTLQPFPGMAVLLREIHFRGISLGLVTTKHSSAAIRQLAQLGLTDLFSTVVTSDRCEHCKPHPDPFLRGLAGLGVAPDVAIGVGDSPHDVESARAAGLVTAVAGWGCEDPARVRGAGPDRWLEHPAELLQLVSGE